MCGAGMTTAMWIYNRLVQQSNGLKRRKDMLKTAEAVSLGHPDKTADYIS
ncbi:MAG TPA: hypothetical protein DD619_05690, partial [Alphaproteobacteria bacterium]|nr:hypothetical protein [Alphaproteobacteria bacterium]